MLKIIVLLLELLYVNTRMFDQFSQVYKKLVKYQKKTISVILLLIYAFLDLLYFFFISLQYLLF